MFGSLIKRAQITIDSAIGQLVSRAIVTVPFVVALGFLTAALSIRLTREYGAETANIILGTAYALVGLVAFVMTRPQLAPASIGNESDESQADMPNEAQAAIEPDLSQADRELLVAALTSAAPIALPSVIRAILRNFPLILAILAAVFVLTQSPDAETDATGGIGEPAR